MPADDPASAPSSAPASAQGSKASSSAQGQSLPARLPQLLVTRSEKLCSKLSKEVNTILAAGASSSSLARTLATGPVATAASATAAAASSAAAAAAAAGEQMEGLQLVDSVSGTAVQRQVSLPQKFIDLRDVHFPATLPMRQLLDMLNAGLPAPFQPGGLAHRHTQQNAAATGSSSSSDSGDSASDSDHSEADSDTDAFCSSAFGTGVTQTARGARSSAIRFSQGHLPATTANTTAYGGPSSAAGAVPQFGSRLPGARSYSSSAAPAAAGGRGLEVDFDIFLGQYWPRFDMRLTRDLDPSLVFAGATGADHS
jgi:hypothetical protein